MGIILETKNLSKYYGTQKSNDKISLKIEEGRIYGLLGPNGAGKSTFLKMISGMSEPTSGEILFCGETFRRSDLYDIGSLIENAPIYDNLTAYENLKARALLYNVEESRINEVLEIVALKNTGKKKSKKFSMGMKQRLGIAIALLNNPKLLILDEPTNGLDPIGIEDLRILFKSLAKEGITIIISSHILNEIQQIADNIAIIVNGKLLYYDEIKDNDDLETVFMEVVRKADY
uniref:lantibiotic protection ABC transporter ATP-binding subunit n=1 Tax=Peptostreptococcus faecalis TaxID=2045015 RepID=UPI001A9A34E1|nr:lantibiotic protection ABC transporter ATP-binding subunit [Peptostreptococcus faecalis]